MAKKIFSLVLTAIWITGLICVEPAYSAAPMAEYLCELGVQFYRQGRYNEALSEFNKVLTLDEDNKTALKYVSVIFSSERQSAKKSAPAEEKPKLPTAEQQVQVPRPGQSAAMEEVMGNYGKKPAAKEEAVQEALEVAGVKISGEAQVRFGVDAGDTVWRRANWDLNEKNYRALSTTAYDRKENTYDPRIYDRLKVQLDTPESEGLGFHSNIVVDPWSFTGKSDKITVTSAFGDAAELELKYWSNTGYTLNESINTLRLGNSFSLPEMKVRDGRVDAFTVTGAFDGHDKFNFPSLKIYRQFQPMREFWLDYNQETVNVRFFPIAYENQALTFDDPLRLSNNRIWWEDSPWIRDWKTGIENSGATPVDFTKGYWDKTLSFFTRDSEGQRLTSLRGVNFGFTPVEGTSLVSGLATPKTLWQDYSEINNVISATRFKHLFGDNFNLGVTYTARWGLNSEQQYRTDAKNYVGGADMSFEFTNGLLANLEFAKSQSYYDLSSAHYKSEATGNTYYFSLVGRYPLESILHTDYGYDGIKPAEGDKFFNKFKFFFCRMDESFDQSLSSYVETRDDESWSRHIHFRQPFKYYYQGEGQTFSWDDIKNYRIGNGIDRGRMTAGMRIESQLWDKRVDNLFDVRNVRTPEGKFVENVVREELTWQMNDKLTSKLLGIYHKLPQTKKGKDPFIFNTSTGRYYDNTVIQDDTNPSINTGSMGLEYLFFEWLSLNGVWEYTNDYSLAYDNFPRGVYNDGSNYTSYSEYDNRYRDIGNWLYYQAFFPKPPYPYYNIFKSGLNLAFSEKMNFYLDYTRNPFEKAGQVDDNMNHVGFEIAYTPTPKFSAFLRYNYSRWQDLDKLISGITKMYGHHNIFLEFIYRRSQDEDLSFQYGEASRDPYMGGILDIGWDPYGGSLRTIDTAHIFRLYYRRKF